MNRDRCEAAHGAGVHGYELGVVDLPGRETDKRAGERDPALEARERGAQAVVGPVTERNMALDHAPDVEALGIVELPRVSVCAAVQQQDLRLGGHDGAVYLEWACHPSAVHG